MCHGMNCQFQLLRQWIGHGANLWTGIKKCLTRHAIHNNRRFTQRTYKANVTGILVPRHLIPIKFITTISTRWAVNPNNLFCANQENFQNVSADHQRHWDCQLQPGAVPPSHWLPIISCRRLRTIRTATLVSYLSTRKSLPCFRWVGLGV